MGTEREMKAVVCLHHIATFMSVAAGGWAVIKGTGSKVKDALAGIFLAVQLFALLKVVLETAGKREETLGDQVGRLRAQIEKTRGGRAAAEEVYFPHWVFLCTIETKRAAAAKPRPLGSNRARTKTGPAEAGRQSAQVVPSAPRDFLPSITRSGSNLELADLEVQGRFPPSVGYACILPSRAPASNTSAAERRVWARTRFLSPIPKTP